MSCDCYCIVDMQLNYKNQYWLCTCMQQGNDGLVIRPCKIKRHQAGLVLAYTCVWREFPFRSADHICETELSVLSMIIFISLRQEHSNQVQVEYSHRSIGHTFPPQQSVTNLIQTRFWRFLTSFGESFENTCKMFPNVFQTRLSFKYVMYLKFWNFQNKFPKDKTLLLKVIDAFSNTKLVRTLTTRF